MIRRSVSTASTRYALVRRAPIEVLKFMLQRNWRKVRADMSPRADSGADAIDKTDSDSPRLGGEPQLKADQLKPGSGDCSGAFPRCP
jgi:hypothetical protein